MSPSPHSFLSCSLLEVREAEFRIDATIGPLEESFSLLNRHELLYGDGNGERVDGLMYAWKNLSDLVSQREGRHVTGAGMRVCVICVCVVASGGADPEHSGADSAQHEDRPAVCSAEPPEPGSELLHRLQPKVHLREAPAPGGRGQPNIHPARPEPGRHTDNIIDYDKCRGPGVEGVAPAEASERLQSFQAEFDQLWRKYTTCSGGEELFGLPVNGTTERLARPLPVCLPPSSPAVSSPQSIRSCRGSGGSSPCCPNSTVCTARSPTASPATTTSCGPTSTSRRSAWSCRTSRTGAAH